MINSPSVSARGRTVEEKQSRETGRLSLVADVGAAHTGQSASFLYHQGADSLPDARGESFIELLKIEHLLVVAIHEMELGVVGSRRRRGMDVETTEEPVMRCQRGSERPGDEDVRSPVVEEPLGGLVDKVLVTEDLLHRISTISLP